MGGPEERKKRAQIGDYLPKETVHRAAEKRKHRREIGREVKYADESYRYCVYPQTEINAMRICHRKFALRTPSSPVRC